MALVYKDGITKTIRDKDLNKYIEMGFKEVKPKEEKVIIEEKPKKAKKGE